MSLANCPLISPVEQETDGFHAKFEKNMKCIEMPTLHEKVAVFMLSWDEAVDDLHTQPEVDELQNVFEERYSFEVTKYAITNSEEPQLQVHDELSRFIRTNLKDRKEKTLLIIYYAGHGMPGDKPGQLRLAGLSSTSTNPEEKDLVLWDSVEQSIKTTSADILVIFDCCHAGALATGYRASKRHVFEFLGACGADQQTCRPGEKSFTSALIWALQGIDKERPFHTKQLLEKIEKAPKLPKTQKPTLFERFNGTNEHIWVAPVNKTGGPPQAHQGVYRNMDDEFIDLRFHYNEPLCHDDAENIATALTGLVREGLVKKPRHVTLMRRASVRDQVQPALDAFMNINRKRKLSKSSVSVQPNGRRSSSTNRKQRYYGTSNATVEVTGPSAVTIVQVEPNE